MERVTITIDEALLGTIDRLVARRGYASRSEAVRDLVREAVDREAGDDPAAPCVATLSYVYDHGVRDLARRLTRSHHDHHDIAVASMHVHLDHEACLEVAVLRGPTGAVRRFADAVTSQRGVRHHSLHLVPVQEEAAGHDHGSGPHVHPHTHA
ncbi:nickel-responsive transcriptional regulator NikR [Paeniroseomonas aquatica]|uniref:Putative nickel-responsive regulator n=1 Tax=Paeniroseomonas aquatica TaxID=373043 RepID=A0ABT8A8R1_9PROT|nr:nickel-responsive transcriptional regulator NikR [Paeniroseomonas aquatica]MDN3565801.1 nickel-responsive transcriptional regulator NikR [Paeniroseomonas aquatica]